MPRGGHDIQKYRPFMSTHEFCNVMDVSMKTLRVCQQAHALEPATVSDDGRSKFWSFDQVEQMALAQALRHGDVPLRDIAAISGNEDDLLEGAFRQTANDIRQTRRMLKAIVHRQNQKDAFAGLEGASGLYVRYLPQRWMALAPATGASPDTIDPAQCTELFLALKKLIDVVGWAATFSCGQLLSLDASLQSAARYLYIELTTPPLPAVPKAGVVDAGCYRAFDQERQLCGCSLTSCVECARFGREPREDDFAAWRRVEQRRDESADSMPVTGNMGKPYEFGIWAERPDDAGGKRQGSGKRGGKPKPGRRGARPMLRPRLMPHEIRLPMGATACMLPAGFYLCQQVDLCKDGIQRQLEVLSGMAQHPFTREEERELSQRIGQTMAERDDEPLNDVPSREPFAMPRAFSDPAYARRHRPVGPEELRRLTLPVSCALRPQNGCCIATSLLRGASNPRIAMHEVQTLIDPATLL